MLPRNRAEVIGLAVIGVLLVGLYFGAQYAAAQMAESFSGLIDTIVEVSEVAADMPATTGS